MDRLSPHETVVMFVAIGTLLGSARILGELCRKFNQPSVLGEILAGILLGPTVLGTLAPELNATLFPLKGNQAIVLDAMTTLAISLFLLVAGLEVDLSMMWRQGRVAISVGFWGMAFPFSVGIAVGFLAPELIGREPDSRAAVFAVFFATALSISALPVIAKTLLDLNLYKTEIGMVIVAAAVFNDLVGWIIFAVVLGLMGTVGDTTHGLTIGQTIVSTLVFAVLMVTVVRWLIHKIVPWIQAHTSWPGGVLGFALTGAIFSAALTEWFGVHAIFGAFLFGVALGDSSHLRERTRATLESFISFFFAPLFFASIGLKVNFAAHFELWLCFVVLAIACFGKIAGCTAGARLAKLPWREAWAIGFGMNARGAMEIILGLLALQAGMIRERMFVALVIMALVTSAMSGPALQRLLRRVKTRRFWEYATGKGFIRPLEAADRWAAIESLAATAAEIGGLDRDLVVRLVTAREELAPTGLANGVAIPHARLGEIARPVVVIGLSEAGIDFDAADGSPAHLIILILTASGDASDQIEILSDIGRSFLDPAVVNAVLGADNFTEFRAVLKTRAGEVH